MLDLIYTFFIAPLELLMNAVLQGGYSLVHSYGWAIVLMSLVVNTVILPIYNKAEGWQEEERAIKKGFEAKEAMIRRTYKGQERFAMLSTMRRQAGYSSRLALRSSVGFFLQIPFFFAAYHLLSHMSALNGVAFGPILNLGAPDALLQWGSVSINVLPLVMTAVNLLSAFIYTATLTKQDKVQLYSLSALFLILLYNSPAALTFYWTLNNIYSLGKNIVEKSWLPRWRANECPFVVSKRLANLTNLKIGRWPAWVPVMLLGILCFGATIALGVNTWQFIRTNFPIPAYRLEFFLIGLALSASLLFVGMTLLRNVRERCNALRWITGVMAITSLLTAVLIVSGFSGVIAHWYTVPKRPASIIVIAVALATISLCFMIALGIIESLFARLSDKCSPDTRQLWLSSFALLTAMLIVGLPVLVFTSDPTSVATTLDKLIPTFIAIWLITFVLGAWLYAISPAGTRYVASVTIFFVLIAAVMYSFVFVGNYGLLNGAELDNPAGLMDRVNPYKDGAIVLGLLIATVLILRKVSLKAVATMCSIGTALVFLSVGGYFLTHPAEVQSKVSRGADEVKVLPSYAKDIFSFSADHRNLVLVIFDMFTGDHLPTILSEEPELKKALEGFVWYRDTLSVGSGTGFGLTAATAGNRYSVKNINADNEGRTYADLYGEAYALIPNLLGKQWNCAVSGYVWDTDEHYFDTKPAALISHAQLKTDWRDYLYGQALFSHHDADKKDSIRRLMSVSIFKSVPYSWRRYVYRDGRWLFRGSESLGGFSVFAPLEGLAKFSSLSSKKDTYRYLYFESSHSGFYFNEQLQPSLTKQNEPENWKQSHPEGYNYRHYLAEKATLSMFAKWIAWLKANNAFDNTRIVVVADHGGWDSGKMMEVLGRVPPRGQLEPKTVSPGLSYPLLMRKDFNASAPLAVSDELMTNGDSIDLLLNGIVNVPKKYAGDIGNPNRIRWYDSSNDWDFSKKKLPGYRYEVNGSMFEKKNWKLLDTKD